MHELAEKDRENRTAVCSVCGPTHIYPSGRGWRCGTKHDRRTRATSTKKGRTLASPHGLLERNLERMTGRCPIDGWVPIVPYGRGYACSVRAAQLRGRQQAAPHPYCDDCRDADRKIVPIVDGRCPVCSMSLNQQLAASADLSRQLEEFRAHLGTQDTDLPQAPLIVGHWQDPEYMPEYESAVHGWKTIGSDTPVATAV